MKSWLNQIRHGAESHLYARPEPRGQAATKIDTRDLARGLKPRPLTTFRYARFGPRLRTHVRSRETEIRSEPSFLGCLSVEFVMKMVAKLQMGSQALFMRRFSVFVGLMMKDSCFLVWKTTRWDLGNF